MVLLPLRAPRAVAPLIVGPGEILYSNLKFWKIRGTQTENLPQPRSVKLNELLVPSLRRQTWRVSTAAWTLFWGIFQPLCTPNRQNHSQWDKFRTNPGITWHLATAAAPSLSRSTLCLDLTLLESRLTVPQVSDFTRDASYKRFA